MKRLLLSLALLILAPLVLADPMVLPRPPELEPDVQFWVRVYSELSTNEGFIHDQHRLSVVYEKIRFDADTPPHERVLRVDAERSHVQDILRHLETQHANFAALNESSRSTPAPVDSVSACGARRARRPRSAT